MSGLQVSLGVVLLLLARVRTQDANCDFYQTISPGSTYHVYSPRYPSSYPSGVQCRWQVTVPAGYRCQVNFTEINLPKTQDCWMDRLMVSRSGDPQMSDADNYCGQGTLSNVVSTGQRFSIGLKTSANSPGGRMYGQIQAVADSSTAATCRCGYKKMNRIVGGEPTQPNEFPMMAAIVYKELSAIRCGGTIITQQHVLTAGHCMNMRNTSNTGVVVGEHDVSTGSDTSATQGFRLQSITVHPQYTSTNYRNDIAVLRIEGTMTFSESVGPACLPFQYQNFNFAGAKLEMCGWGTTLFGGPASNVLRKVTVDCISQGQCQSSVPSLVTTQICTYTPGKDSCQLDSGGPMLYTETSTGRLFLVGIISQGKGCASGPGIGTRVTSYLDWIVSVTGGDFCRK